MNVQSICILCLCACLLSGCAEGVVPDAASILSDGETGYAQADIQKQLPAKTALEAVPEAEASSDGEDGAETGPFSTEDGAPDREESRSSEPPVSGEQRSATEETPNPADSTESAGQRKKSAESGGQRKTATETDTRVNPGTRTTANATADSGANAEANPDISTGTNPAAASEAGNQGTGIGGGTAEQESITYLVDLDTSEDVSRSPEGVELASYTYQLPVMVALRRDRTVVTEEDILSQEERKALSVAEAFNREFRKWADEEADFAGLVEYAREVYGERQENGVEWDAPFEQSLECEVHQVGMLMSVMGNLYSFAGGAHPNTILLSWNYDMRAGKFLSPSDIFEEMDPIRDDLLRQAEELAGECEESPDDYYFPDYRDTLENWEETAAVSFDRDAMTVAYSPYDLAPYAAGPQLFSIPMAELTPLLNDYGKALLNR